MFDKVVEKIRDINPDRNQVNAPRRVLKMLEELGEASEAYLSVSSPHNYKNKTWNDVREELVDVMIVLVDLLWTPVEGGTEPSRPYIDSQVHGMPVAEMPFDIALIGKAYKVALLNEPDRQMERDVILEDALYAASNVAFARLPSDTGTDLEIQEQIRDMFFAKLAKWENNMTVYRAADNGK